MEAEEQTEFWEPYWNFLKDTEVFELQGVTVYAWHLAILVLVLVLVIILACCTCLCWRPKKTAETGKNEAGASKFGDDYINDKQNEIGRRLG